MDISVLCFASAFAEAVEDFSCFSSCISACFGIGLIIYLFLRKILADVAKDFEIFPGHSRSREARRDIAGGLLQRKIEEMNLAEKGSELEKR